MITDLYLTCSASYVVCLLSVTQYIPATPAATHALPTLKEHLRHESALPLAAKLQADTASILLLHSKRYQRGETSDMKSTQSSWYLVAISIGSEMLRLLVTNKLQEFVRNFPEGSIPQRIDEDKLLFQISELPCHGPTT